MKFIKENEKYFQSSADLQIETLRYQQRLIWHLWKVKLDALVAKPFTQNIFQAVFDSSFPFQTKNIKWKFMEILISSKAIF